MTPNEDLLGAELHRLTDTLAPSSDPAGDLRRGRRRRARTRLAVSCCGAVAAVASASAVVVLVTGAEPAPVAQDPTPTTVPGTTEPATATPTPAVTFRCVDSATGGPGRNGRITALAPDLIDTYRTILVERLDPTERHLGPGRTNEQVGTTSDPACSAGQSKLESYGTKLDWRVPGESGLGMIQVEVTSGPWDEAQMQYGYDSWRPQPVDLPGVSSAEVTTYAGGFAVVVHRTDGVSVGIDANTLFGNNSRTPVSDMELTVTDILAAAADPRFRLS
jgi:hypothetical protein